MRIPRSALTALLATTATTISAFTAPSRTFVSNRAAFAGTNTLVNGRIAFTGNNAVRASSSTGLNMIFDRLFGGGGGAYETKIDYSALDHPGPELGEAAANNQVLATSPRDPNLQLMTIAGGCFWGLELAYQRVPGVVYTAVGYAQGKETYPTYGQVCSGSTGHTEAVMVYYDPKEVTYEQLLDTFFDRVNPTTVNGQGNDFGTQYRTGVYFHTPEQEKVARARFEQEQTKYKKPIATELKAATPFWPAEKYHQQYLEKGGRFGTPQNAAKGATDTIRCYG